MGLIKWFDATASFVSYLRTSNSKQSKYVKNQWDNLQCDQDLLKSSPLVAMVPPDHPPTNTEVTVTVGPLLTTTWGQDCGYNSHCPPASDGPCGYAYTGCVATAMAQVMAYWQSPSTYNWSQMPSNYGTDDVAVLMRDIGNSVGMSYSGTGSGASASNIVGALINTFHYSSANYSSYGISSYNTVQANLNNNRPVLLGGCNDQTTILGIPISYSTCHEWVCDGYLETTFYYENGMGSTYLLFHMNWGWGLGLYDGWFAFNDWHISNGRNYRYADDMVYNIHP